MNNTPHVTNGWLYFNNLIVRANRIVRIQLDPKSPEFTIYGNAAELGGFTIHPDSYGARDQLIADIQDAA